MKLSLVVVSLLVLTGCGGRVATSAPPSPPSAPASGQAAATAFDRALPSFVAHDAANDWNETSCRQVDVVVDMP